MNVQAEDVARSLIDNGVPFVLPTVGFSMVPIVWPRMTVVVSPFVALPVVGDIAVVVRAPGRLVAHRVVSVSVGSDGRLISVVTQGDSLCRDDGPTMACDVLGRVTEVRVGRFRISAVSGALAATGRLLQISAPVSRLVNSGLAWLCGGIARWLKRFF